MSVYGDKDLLLKLQGALLPSGDAGENPSGDAVFRTEDDVVSSGDGGFTSDRKPEGEEAIGVTKDDRKQ